MFDRATAIRKLGVKASLALVLGASVLLAACGGSSSTSTGTSSTSTNGLLACTATETDLTVGAGGTGTPTKTDGLSGQAYSASGSSALQPLIKQAAAEFDQVNGSVGTIAAGGSGKGLSDVNAGAVQIGMSDLFQSDKQISGLTDHQVAAVAFTLVVSKDLQGKVNNLTQKQIQDIYTGTTTNWSQIGGPSEPINVVNRPTSSGTRGTFKKYVLGGATETPGTTLTEDNTGAVFTAVSQTPGSIGYVSTGFVLTPDNKGKVSPICIDGAKATATDINSGKYKFWAIEHAYTKGAADGVVKSFLTYVEGSDFQTKDLAKLNFLQVSTISADAIKAHTPAGEPEPESFYSK